MTALWMHFFGFGYPNLAAAIQSLRVLILLKLCFGFFWAWQGTVVQSCAVFLSHLLIVACSLTLNPKP